mmetsp:Transcript_3820/g.3915  ORF Transcript_3820/g.3915 Transcript_3820/m.3915 type:complete len:218 (+) Transcript_3820:69-722(+)
MSNDESDDFETRRLLTQEGIDFSKFGRDVGTVHDIPLDDFLKMFATNKETGLAKSYCKSARQTFGLNVIPAPVSLPSWLCCLLPCLSYSKTLSKFNDCLPDHSEVLRDSRWILLDTSSIVPGDLIRLGRHDRVPADARIIEILDNSKCLFDTSAVSGSPEEKVINVKNSTNNYLDAQNMIFAGYLCKEGSCMGVVVATGPLTHLGKLISKGEWPVAR